MSSYTRQIFTWTAIGLSIRLILMPFTMHGQDLVFINYFPMMAVKEGIWDPYSLINKSFSYFPATYYGPVIFAIMSIANFIFVKLLNATSLVQMLEISSTMMARHCTTVDYVRAFHGLGLFKNLFLMKSPYLVFDFLIAAILLKLAFSKEYGIKSYRLWMLNIVVLHSAYAVGGPHLITAFFIISALYAAVRKRSYLAVALLSIGGGTMLFPYILILPACFLLGDNWRMRLSLLSTAGVVSILIYLPFYLSSRNSIFSFFTMSHGVTYSGIAKWILSGIFAILYLRLCVNAVKDSRAADRESILLYYFVITMFLFYTTFPVRFRYFVSLTPLLALIIPRHRRFGIFIFFVIVMLAFLWLTQRDTQMGLFSPIDPEYFMRLPTAQELSGRLVNIETVYKIIARVLILTFFIASWWIWRIKSSIGRGLGGYAKG